MFKKFRRLFTLASLISITAVPVLLFSAPVDMPPKDVIFVIDSSKSMVGLGTGYRPHNIFNIVKEQLKEAVDNTAVGDRVTLVGYGSSVVVYPTYNVDSEAQKENIKKQIDNLRASYEWTYTAKMVRSLADLLRDMAKRDTSRKQLAMIFSDAIDDPPPVNVDDVYRLGEDQQFSSPCAPTDSKFSTSSAGRYVYFFSLSDSELNKALANQLLDCFPDIRIEHVLDPELKLQESLRRARINAEMGLIPALEVDAVQQGRRNFRVKAGEELDFSIRFNANRAADGQVLTINTNEQLHARILSVENGNPDGNYVITEGANEVLFKVKIPYRANDTIKRLISFGSLSGREDIFFLPDGNSEVELMFNVTPLSFWERFVLPEYWIPAFLLLIALLYGLYHFIKYITFRPLFRLYYSISEPAISGRMGRKDSDAPVKRDVYVDIDKNINLTTDGESLNSLDSKTITVKYFLDVVGLDAGQSVLVVASDADDIESAEDAYVIRLEDMKKKEEISFTKIGDGRNTKFKIDQRSLLRLRNRRFFRGVFLKNKSNFEFGNYNFVVESNLR